MRIPDFLAIGFQRCGTSWLDDHLRRHPQIWLPPLKELHYFDARDPACPMPDYRYGTHLSWRLRQYRAAAKARLRGRQARIPLSVSNLRWDLRYFTGRADDRWYVSLFERAKDAGKTVGEITPDYSMLSPDYIKRVKALNPNIRLIFIMRDPIDRSWSAATKDLCTDKGVAIRATSEEAFLDYVLGHMCCVRTDYLETLKIWRSEFGPSQIHVAFFDDMVERPRTFLNSILEFLGVQPASATIDNELRRPINRSAFEAVPRRVELELAKLYEPKLRDLKAAFGATPGKWHRRALDVLAAPG